MRTLAKSAVVGISALAIAGGLLGMGAGAAFADSGATSTLVPYSPDPNAIGTLSFFDAAGSPLTSGSVNDPYFAAYSVASGTGVNAGAQDTKATLYAFTPVAGVLPANWQGNDQLTSSTDYPAVSGAINPTVPASISGQPNATATGQNGDTTLAQAIGDNPNNATGAYQGLYEMRVLTAHAGGSTDPNAYYAADIKVTGTTWALINPAPAAATATSTTLTATPASGANTSTSVVLTATESPAAAGSVQFKDGATNIGAPVAVNGSGVATATTTFTTAGSHSLSAVFTPTSSAFTGSTGTLAYSVAGVVTSTSTALSANPTTGGAAYSAITLTASLNPITAAGSVQFLEGTTVLGTVAVNASGDAVLSYSLFAEGSHTITAKFVPTDATAFGSSTSAAVVIAVGPPAGAVPDPQTVTATVLPGSLTISTPYTPANPLNLGTLQQNTAGTLLTTSAQFGVIGNPIQVTDTRAGNLPWTASALSGLFSNGGTGQINPENLGLTNLQYVLTTGNALNAGNVAVYDNTAANGVAVADNGTLGLGGTAPHRFADTAHGFGTIGFTGTMTLNAPTSTLAGVYTATVVFTVG